MPESKCDGRCCDVNALAHAIMGARLGGVPISWDEAYALAMHIIRRLHGKG